MTFHYIICLGIGGSKRGKLFSQEWMDEHFGKEHKEQIGTDIKKGGYPEHGNGRYAMQLGYADWMAFTLDQRIHYNYLENFMQVITGIAMSGLHFPRTAAIWGGLYTLSRIIYSFGYRIGPAVRVYGAPIVMLTQFGLPIFTIVSLAMLAQSGKVPNNITK